ncbi:MAG: response regulator [Deltaproteobacteria bacterium]|nr:response regulator [Deltaproteobacteria bacterium]
MAKPLRILFVEDRDDDVELVMREIRRGGSDGSFERVDTPEAFGAALDRGGWDVVLCDYAMPRFSAMAALAQLKEKKIDLPFIVISGTIGEETAVECLRAGAHDFVTKEKLARLLPAIDRELREAAMRAERRKMEEELLITNRMASLGALAAGLAHEINNPFAVVAANLQVAVEGLAMALAEAESREEKRENVSVDWLVMRIADAKEALDDAGMAAHRVSEVTRHIRIFSHAGETDQREPVDVRRVMESSLRLATHEIRHRARVVKDYADVPAVWGNESRLGQVFLNVLINAAQAIPEGQTESNEIGIVVRAGGDGRVVVGVHDSGAGIPAENISRVFDPFFTTKPEGIGTGLGLAICHRVVTSMGGEIRVESEVGKGTVVQLLFLIAERDAAIEREVAVTPVAAPAKRGRILVIDDEPLVLGALRRILAPMHDVETVTAATVALERIAGGERFDVILCDIVMPRTTGIEFYEALALLAPEQVPRVVFISGAVSKVASEFIHRFRCPLIEKPFDCEKLLLTIQGILTR